MMAPDGDLDPYAVPSDMFGPGGIFLESKEGFEYLESKTGITSYGKERSMGERLTYETGICYIAGVLSGGFYGLGQGIRSSKGLNFKLKMNSILNHSGRTGSRTGNAFGVFALFYSLTATGLRTYRKKNDIYNDIGGIAGAGTMAALPKGPVTAIGMGIGLGSVATMMVFGKLKLTEKEDFTSDR